MQRFRSATRNRLTIEENYQSAKQEDVVQKDIITMQKRIIDLQAEVERLPNLIAALYHTTSLTNHKLEDVLRRIESQRVPTAS